MGTPERNGHSDLGQFDNRWSRRRRRVWWLAGIAAVVIVLFTVIPRLADRPPEMPAHVIGRSSLLPSQVDWLPLVVEPDGMEPDIRDVPGLVETAVGYYSHLGSNSDTDLVGIEIRIERYGAETQAREAYDEPYISTTWGMEWIAFRYFAVGHEEALPSAASGAVLELGRWMDYAGDVLCTARVYTWSYRNLVVQIMAMGWGNFASTREAQDVCSKAIRAVSIRLPT